MELLLSFFTVVKRLNGSKIPVFATSLQGWTGLENTLTFLSNKRNCKDISFASSVYFFKEINDIVEILKLKEELIKKYH